MAKFREEFQHSVSPAGETHRSEGTTISLWQHTSELENAKAGQVINYPPLQDEFSTDVVIVGGGITGLTTAYLLQTTGYNVALVDTHSVGYGVSGFNSGHLTSMLLDMKYSKIISAFGEENTRTIGSAIQKSIDMIERIVLDNHIDCRFRRIPGYLYAEYETQRQALYREHEAASKAGLQLNRVYRVPLPFTTDEGSMVGNQARFHPLKYVQGLARLFTNAGGRIFENSQVQSVQSGSRKTLHAIETAQGRIHAEEIVLATHTPIGLRPALQSRLTPLRSYIIGIRADNGLEDALFWDMDEPYHYIRLAKDEHGVILIIGGEDHKTGEHRDTDVCFQNLEHYARDRFRVRSVDYHWSAQLYDPADGLPYIGKISGVYVATGFSGEGLTFGTLAGKMISDQIRGIRNPCDEILDPNRTDIAASAEGFISENVGTISHLVKDRLQKAAPCTPEEIPIGEGRICSINGDKTAVYHADDDVFHLFSPVCTHMKCIVAWNESEKSWDCPCHGGRFDANGNVLNGPPVEPLRLIKTEQAQPESDS